MRVNRNLQYLFLHTDHTAVCIHEQHYERAFNFFFLARLVIYKPVLSRGHLPIKLLTGTVQT